MITVTVCVGSSCHVKGARELIDRFNAFLETQKLHNKVELKGAFCMDHCGKGINWKINEEIITSSSVKEGDETFQKRILEVLEKKAVAKPIKGQRKT